MLILISLLVVLIIGLYYALKGCAGCVERSYTEPKTLKKESYVYHGISCAVTSKDFVFDAEDVRLKFYFGPDASKVKDGWPHAGAGFLNGYERIGFAAYYHSYKSEFQDPVTQTYADYRDIENLYFIKEFSNEEFLSEEYSATCNSFLWVYSILYRHNEIFTVPKEILYKTYGSFCFCVVEIYYSEDSNDYVVWRESTRLGGIQISYEYIDENTVRLG